MSDQSEFIKLLQEKMAGKGRRLGDDGRERGFVWDDETRDLLGSIVAELFHHTQRNIEESLGCSAATHAQHHEGLGELIPWITAQKIKAERQAAFWDALTRDIARDGVKFAVKWALLLLLLGAGITLANALKLLPALPAGG